MIGLSSILIIKKYPNHESNHRHYDWNTEYISTSTLEVPTAKFAGCIHASSSINSTVTSLLRLPE